MSLLGVLLLGMMVLWGSCALKGWRYDECLLVGHTEAYCTAEWVGCFSGRGQ